VNEDRPWLGDEPTGRVDPTFHPVPTGIGVFFAVASPIVFAAVIQSGGTNWALFVAGIAIGIIVGVVTFFVMDARGGRGPRTPL
jgi:hypothetical protein